jgi:hypothetical protein
LRAIRVSRSATTTGRAVRRGPRPSPLLPTRTAAYRVVARDPHSALRYDHRPSSPARTPAIPLLLTRTAAYRVVARDPHSALRYDHRLHTPLRTPIIPPLPTCTAAYRVVARNRHSAVRCRPPAAPPWAHHHDRDRTARLTALWLATSSPAAAEQRASSRCTGSLRDSSRAIRRSQSGPERPAACLSAAAAPGMQRPHRGAQPDGKPSIRSFACFLNLAVPHPCGRGNSAGAAGAGGGEKGRYRRPSMSVSYTLLHRNTPPTPRKPSAAGAPAGVSIVRQAGSEGFRPQGCEGHERPGRLRRRAGHLPAHAADPALDRSNNHSPDPSAVSRPKRFPRQLSREGQSLIQVRERQHEVETRQHQRPVGVRAGDPRAARFTGE